jgi:hypothetical protein
VTRENDGAGGGGDLFFRGHLGVSFASHA